MANQPTKRIVEPQHFVPPTRRELRAQAVQRLQTGLFGLAAILLIVGLANIINDRARMIEGSAGAQAPAAQAGASTGANSDPLADIGVVPSNSPEEQPASGPVPARAN